MSNNNVFKNVDMVKEKVADMKNNLMGLHTSLKEYVCDESGNLSDEKIEYFTGELIHALYGSDYGCEYTGIGGSTAKMIKNFVYLVLRAYGGYGEGIYTFADILSAAEKLHGKYGEYSSLYQLEQDEYDELLYYENQEDDPFDDNDLRYASVTGFWSDLNTSYEILTGQSYVEENREAIGKKLEAKKAYDEELQKLAEKAERKYKIEKTSKEVLDEKYKADGLEPLWNEEYMSDSWEDEYYHGEEYLEDADAVESIGDENANGGEVNDPLECDEDDSQMNDLSQEENAVGVVVYDANSEEQKLAKKNREDSWKNSLEDIDRFIEKYKEFRELFEIGFDSKVFETAVICLLCRDGKCKLNNSKDFLKFFIALDDAYLVTKEISNRE